MEFNEIATRIVGVHMFLVSILGLLLNFYMFYYFSSLQKTSFYILCTSKTISNSMALLIYLCYVAPVNAFYTEIGSSNLNSYLNQTLGFGLILQGPITQMMITVNRLLVVWFFPITTPKYSVKITLVALSISWIFVAWFSTLYGLPAHCRIQFGFDHVGFSYSLCNMEITWYLVYSLFILAGCTNLMNILIAAKLFCSSKSQLMLSIESTRNRRKLSIRFFFQSCFQDWICVLDVINNFSSTIYCTGHVCITLVTMGFDVLVYGFDGFVMYIFNYKLVTERKPILKNIKSSDFLKSKILVVSPVSS